MLKNFKNIAVVSLSTGGSRILGLLRDVMLFAALGASQWNSAFILAFTLPNLFRRLLGEGAMTSAMVPIFSEVLEREGRSSAFAFFSEVFLRLLVALVVLCTVLMVALELLVHSGQLSEHWILGTELSVLLLPYMIFICLSAIVAAGLNVIGRFAAPASTPILLNLAIIFALVLAMQFDKAASETVYWLCAGVLIGGALQLLVPAVDLARQGWRPHRLAKGESSQLNELFSLLLPGLMGAAILQVNIMVSRLLAHSLNDSAVSVLYLASRLMELPLGLFTVSVVTVFFPVLARTLAGKDEVGFADSISSGMRLISAISVPAGVGLFVMGEPIVELLRFGQFAGADAAKVATLVAIYGVGLPFYSAATFVTRGLHAGKSMLVTVRIAGICLLVNLLGSLILMQVWEERGLAAANVLAAVVQSVLLWLALRQRRHAVRFGVLLPAMAKIILAALAMGLVCRLALPAIAMFELSGKSYAACAVGLLIPVGMAIYFMLLALLRFEEMHMLGKLLRIRK